MLKQIKSFKFLALSSFFAIGILLTYGRTTWAVTLIGLLVIIYVLGFQKSFALMGWLILVAILAMGSLAIAKPATLAALADRATSANRELNSGASAQWRYYEASLAIPQIIASPIVGLGLGAAYRPPASSDVVPEQVRYIHDGYLYMADKLGIPALLLFIWFLIEILKISLWGATHELELEFRAVYVAVFAGIINIFVSSITEPHIMSDYGLTYIAVLAGFAVALRRQSEVVRSK